MSIKYPGLTIGNTLNGVGATTRRVVRVTTSVNGIITSSFANGQIVDGVTLVTGDRILIKNQTTGIQNGIYTVQSAGSPVRTSDYDEGESVAGTFILVTSGTLNADTGWICTNDYPNDIVGTDSLAFKLISGDVSGPSGMSTDNAIVRWDGTDGIKVQNSALLIDDSNNMTGLQYLQFNDIASPSNPLDGQGRLYKKNGDDGIWWKPDSSGIEVDLTATGGGGGGVTNVGTGTGLTGGPITSTGTISLADTSVVAGSYIHTNLTVDAQGRITTAADGDVVTLKFLSPSGTAGNIVEVVYNDAAIAGVQLCDGTPSLRWSRQQSSFNTTGSESLQLSNSIAVDLNKNVYVTYFTNGTATGGVNSGGTDIVVFKLDSCGNSLWTTQQAIFNTTNSDTIPSIAVDLSGNVYIAYTSQGTVTGGVNSGVRDVVVFKLNTAGTHQWTRQQAIFNTASFENNPDIAVDSSGNVYVTYYTSGGTIPGGTFSGGTDEIVVFKLDTNGVVQWTRQQSSFNTSGSDGYSNIAVDSIGNSFITYFTTGTVSGGVNSGGRDIVVAKFDTVGTLQWTRQQAIFNTSSNDEDPCIALDSNGNIYVAYNTSGGTISGGVNSGGVDVVVFKLNSAGTHQWSKQLAAFNTSATDLFSGRGMAVDSAGNVYVTYFTTGTVSGGVNSGGFDIVVFKLDTAGTHQWSKQQAIFNTSTTDFFPSVAVDSSGDIYVTYYTAGAISGGVNIGGDDIVVFKLGPAEVFGFLTQNAVYGDLVRVSFPGATIRRTFNTLLPGLNYYLDENCQLDTCPSESFMLPFGVAVDTSRLLTQCMNKINTGAGLTGGPITSTGTISVATGGITNSMLQNSSLTVTAGTGLSGGGIVSLGGSVSLANAGVTSFQTSMSGLSPSISSTGAITLSGILGATSGGTGQSSYTIGDLLYADTSTTLAKLADVAIGNALISGGIGVAPSWGKIGLTTHVSGILPIANGGTNSGTALNNNRIMVSSSGSIIESGALTNGQILIGSTGLPPVIANITGGTGISVTNGAGSITLNNTGVTSVTGTTNQIATSASTGAITLSTPSTFIAPGTIQDTSGTLYSTSATVTAAGASQGTATGLTSSFNNVVSVAVGTGVVLQTPTAAGYIVGIINNGANPLNVYPSVGGTIDAAGTNNPIVLPVGASITLQATSVTQWYTVNPPIVGGSGATVVYGNGRTTISATGGGASPLTTKGDIWVYSTGDTRLGVGTNNYLLTADSTQTTGLRWAQSITPAQLPFNVVTDTLVADQNNYNPVGLSSAVQLRLTASGATRSITGLVISGSSSVPNLSELKITNVGTQFNIILRAESASSTAANRFTFDGQDIVLLPGQNCTVWYDWTTSRWRGVACSQDGRIGGQDVTAGVISPPIIATDQNDYTPTGLENASVIRLIASAVVNITGLAGGVDGRRLVLFNIGTLPITLVHQSLSSLAANRFFTGTSNTTIVGNNAASLVYDGTSGFWRIYSGTGGAITGAGGLIQSQWKEVIDDRVTTSVNWVTYFNTINAAAVLPTGTITVVSTGITAATPTVPGSPAANAASVANPQTLIIQSTTNDAQIVTYTGSTGTTFTGCTGGLGAIAVGNYVWNGPLQTSITAGSNGVALPTGTINVVSTTGFPTPGILLVTTSNGTQRVTYTGTTATTFTGCVGGTGIMSTGGMIYNVSEVTPHDLLTINVTTSGGALIIIATANASTDSNRTGYFQVLVDGFFRRGGSTQGNGGAPSGSSVVSLKLSNVPAGDHVVTVRWVVEGGNFAIRPVTRSQDNNASLLVQEVSS
jgi:hypothetical protein